MPTIDVQLFAAFDTQQFFAPAISPIALITGTDLSAIVTLQDGLMIAYSGTGLQFNGTLPTDGTVTGVQVLRADGVVLARMDLTLAPWQFAEITGPAPRQSYNANAHRQIYNFADIAPNGLGNAYFEGGDQADQLQNFFGVDTLLGGAGDDLIRVSGGFYPTRAAPAGLTLNGGAGTDLLEISGGGTNGVDLRLATIRSIEALTTFGTALRLSGDQIGNGALSATATLVLSGATQPLMIDQTAGRSVDLSRFTLLFPTASATQINGTTGNDTQIGNANSADVLLGGDGNDRLSGRGGSDRLFGGLGNDILIAGDDPAPVPNSFGFTPPDELFGGDGNDRLTAGNSQTVLYGGTGDDSLFGGSGLSSVFGDDGNDWLMGGTGTFAAFGGGFAPGQIIGGAGNDTLVTATGGGRLIGGIGDDRLVINHAGSIVEEAAGGGNDRILTTVSLTLLANAEVERIIVKSESGLAVTGSDTGNVVVGNLGNDTLNGSGGDDTLIGGAGADSLTGGIGNDRLTGGAGNDVFVFSTGLGRDVITDFSEGEDQIALAALTAVDDFADLQANHLTQVGAHVHLDAGSGDVLIIRNTLIANLDAADFVF